MCSLSINELQNVICFLLLLILQALDVMLMYASYSAVATASFNAFLSSFFAHFYTRTHTRPFNGPLSGTTQVSRYQKGKTNLDFTEPRSSEWQWHQLAICNSAPHSTEITTPAPLHSVFLRAGCSSCRPTNSIRALKAHLLIFNIS